METENKILELLGLENNEEIQAALDIYQKTKSILERTDVALGRKVEYEIQNISSSNSYNLPLNERYTTY